MDEKYYRVVVEGKVPGAPGTMDMALETQTHFIERGEKNISIEPCDKCADLDPADASYLPKRNGVDIMYKLKTTGAFVAVSGDVYTIMSESNLLLLDIPVRIVNERRGEVLTIHLQHTRASWEGLKALSEVRPVEYQLDNDTPLKFTETTVYKRRFKA